MKTIILLSVSILLLGCKPVYYVPNSHNVPIMKSKDQFNLSGGLTNSAFTNGFELQTAYGITDKYALQLNGYWVNGNEDSNHGNGNFFEIGAGYYKNLPSNFVFETYGLVGFGTFEYKDEHKQIGTWDPFWGTLNSDLIYGNIKADVFRLGIQPSISYGGEYFSASFSTRIMNLTYNSIQGNLNSEGNGFTREVDYLKANNSNFLIEPAITLQAGFENLKLQLQYVYSYNLTNPEFKQEIDMLSIGLKININPK